MKVLLLTRSRVSVATSPGGDVVQAHETARALSDFGVDARVSSELRPDLKDIDIVHIFNLIRPQEAVVQARHAWRHGRPVALSTVYADMWDFDLLARKGVGGFIARHSDRNVIEVAKAAGRVLRSREVHRGLLPLIWPGYHSLQKELLARCAMLLPNSRSELSRIERDCGMRIADERVTVVPNGIDPTYYNSEQFRSAGTTAPPELQEYRDCVLCIGCIEGRKNQLNLIRALRDTELRLVLAGPPAANQHAYVKSVEDEIAMCPNAVWIGPVGGRGEAKLWLYELARVHALPSWMETTGLVSLEAAALNCAIVVSPNGDTRDYFEGYAHFCEPDDVDSIKRAVEEAYAAGPDARLRSRVMSEFTWENAAKATYEAYLKIEAAKDVRDTQQADPLASR